MIPLSVPHLGGNEWNYIKDCLDTNWVSSVGSYVTAFENKVAEFCGVRKAIATSNGTAALHISLILAGVQAGDLIILPNITFVAPANAITYVGARPLLVDIYPDTWQMDLELLEKFFVEETELNNDQCIHKASGKRIGALMPVHVLGNVSDMDRLTRLAHDRGLPIVEDATEALGSYYNDKHAGSFGSFGCLSFNGNKIITTGGGGMILCDDEKLAAKAKHLTTQAKSDPREYYHDEVGYNYRLVNILAAMGLAQMEQLPSFLKRKKEIAGKYSEFFTLIKGAQPQVITKNVSSNYWLYTVRLNEQEAVRTFMGTKKIEVRPFWVPMNQLPAFRQDIYFHSNDISNTVYRNCLSFPCSSGLSNEEQDEVLNALNQFYHAR
jgi:perosamine synthetase